ncbi:MAG: hypothetical protein V4657_07300 [Pseudomonadota bacterium]
MPLAIAVVGAAAVGAGASIVAGNKAAKAQKNAANSQIAESRRQYDQDRADLQPWRDTGRSALDVIAREYGLNGQPAAGGGQSSAFFASPDYKFRNDQQLKALERMQNARGLWNSGATRTALLERSGDLASAEYGNWFNRLSGIAGTGQAATNTGIQAGQNSTAQINNATQQAGNARASSYANTGSAINGGINNVLSAYLFQKGGGFGR